MTQRKIQTSFCHVVRIERLADDDVVIDGLANLDVTINSHIYLLHKIYGLTLVNNIFFGLPCVLMRWVC